MQRARTFTVRLKKDPDTGWFAVRCVELPEAISQGKTEEVALKNIKEAIELVLEEYEQQAKREGGRLTEISVWKTSCRFWKGTHKDSFKDGVYTSPPKGKSCFLETFWRTKNCRTNAPRDKQINIDWYPVSDETDKGGVPEDFAMNNGNKFGLLELFFDGEKL